MKKAEKILERISIIIAWIGVGLTAATLVMYTIDVVGRLAFSSQMRGTFEVAQFFFCMISFSAYAYTQMSRGHIHVSIVVNLFPMRMKYIVAILNFAICSIVCSIVVVAMINMGNIALASNKTTQVGALPFAPLYYLSAVFMAVFTATIIFDVIRSILALCGNTDAKASIDKVFSS